MVVSFIEAKERIGQRKRAKDALFPAPYRCPYADGIDYLTASWPPPAKIINFYEGQPSYNITFPVS